MSIVQYSEDLSKWLNQKLDGISISSDDTSRAAAACLDMAMEHQIAVTILVKNELYGSAFSLARCAFEAYIRGTWLKNCATKQQTKLYLKDKLGLIFKDYINELEKLDAYSEGVLTFTKKNSWKLLNSLTHTGAHQAIRRNSDDCIEPNYESEEIKEIVGFVNAISILAGHEVAGMAKDQEMINDEEFLEKMKEYANIS